MAKNSQHFSYIPIQKIIPIFSLNPSEIHTDTYCGSAREDLQSIMSAAVEIKIVKATRH
jgi:hypothetical protein